MKPWLKREKIFALFQSGSAQLYAFAGAATGALFLWWSFLLIPLSFFLLPRSRFVCFAAALLLVHTGAFLRCFPSDSEMEVVLNGRGEAGNFTAKLTDRRLCNVSGVDPLLFCKGEIRELNGKKLSGKIMLRFPGPAPLRCGDIITGTGVLTPPQNRAEFWQMELDSFMVKEREISFSTWICDCRDGLLKRLLSGINNDTDRNLAAAFFFGATSGLNRERRKDFIASGTVHLFAVSGLHIGLAAAIILWLLRIVPFRIRHLTAALLTVFYVLLTGAAIPALRAGMMIALFLIFRAFLLRELPLRLLTAAATVIVIVDPASLTEPGFQFSFLITATLLALSARLKEERVLFFSELQVMPNTVATRKQEKQGYRAYAIVALLCGCIVAFLAGSTVSLYHFGSATPVALAVNPLILPGLGVLFALMPIKLLCAGIPLLNTICALALERSFELLRSIAGIAASLPSFWQIPAISACEGIGAALLILLFFQLKCRKKAALCGILFTLFCLSFPLRALGKKPEIIVYSRDSFEAASVLFFDPVSNTAAVINPGAYANKQICRELRRRGVLRLNAVGFSRASVRTASGVSELLREFPVDQIILPERRRGDWRFLELLETNIRSSTPVSKELCREKWKIFAENEDFKIEYFDFGAMLNWCTEVRVTPEGRSVTFRKKAEPPETALLPWSNQCGAIHYEW